MQTYTERPLSPHTELKMNFVALVYLKTQVYKQSKYFQIAINTIHFDMMYDDFLVYLKNLL